MILTLDVGNTRIKAAVFENDTVLGHFVFLKTEASQALKNILKNFPAIRNLIVASVGNLEKSAFSEFENRVTLHYISPSDAFPFENDYRTPLTLGIDRLVLAAGAVFAFPAQNRLVIDAGTCITYDFVSEKDVYLGGAISPGLALRYQSLHEHTAKLPLLQAEMPEHYIGKTTAEAIHSGIVNGIIGEIEGFIRDYEAQYPKFTIILTGGDTDFLAKRLKNTIFANSNFLLESLNHLFQYTIKK